MTGSPNRNGPAVHLRLSRILVATLATAALAVSAPALAVAFPLDRPAPEKRPTVVVAVRYASQVAAVRAAAERAGGHVDEQYRWNALLVSLPAGGDTAGLEAAVRGVAGVRYAQRPTIVHATATATNDPVFPLQWGTTRIGANTAWDVTQGEGVAIAEIDTGVDYTHRDLVGRPSGR